MSKFNVGDLVKCIGESAVSNMGNSSGWVKDKIFIIHEVRNINFGGSCYFPLNESGVYEESLELIKINKGKIPYILSKEKIEQGVIYYNILTGKEIKDFRFYYYDENKRWSVAYDGKDNRETLLLVCSILRGLESGKG